MINARKGSEKAVSIGRRIWEDSFSSIDLQGRELVLQESPDAFSFLR